jgi:glycosyltransferase involved in cell wall biosynthesis
MGKRDDVRFQILGPVGSKNRSAISKQDVDDWCDQGTIEYLGEHPDVRPYIEQADCVVLPSYREGAPRTLLESASMARPLIATNVAGCKHVIDDEITGLLCKVKDAADLEKTIDAFLRLSLRERSEMGAAGRQKMQLEYAQERVVASYCTAINELTETRLIHAKRSVCRHNRASGRSLTKV